MQRISVLIVLLMTGLAVWMGIRPLDPYAVPNPDPNHTHADFAVWVNGKQADYSSEEFMSEQEDEEADDDHATHGHTHHDYLHLHDANGAVIHRHKPGLSVGEFFGSIGVLFEETCYVATVPMGDGEVCGESPFRMFVNGSEVAFNTAYVFEDLDQILITNAVDSPEVQRQLTILTNDACLYSQRCPWRGAPPAENCLADPAVPCVE